MRIVMYVIYIILSLINHLRQIRSSLIVIKITISTTIGYIRTQLEQIVIVIIVVAVVTTIIIVVSIIYSIIICVKK